MDTAMIVEAIHGYICFYSFIFYCICGPYCQRLFYSGRVYTLIII
jgi:hypothetical protein